MVINIKLSNRIVVILLASLLLLMTIGLGYFVGIRIWH